MTNLGDLGPPHNAHVRGESDAKTPETALSETALFHELILQSWGDVRGSSHIPSASWI